MTAGGTDGTTRPLLLDLFCGAGGAAVGYHRAGFDVVGVDIKPQPRYPFEFHQADVMEWLPQYLRGWWVQGRQWTAVHASPPCQAYTNAQKIRNREHPDLIAPVRGLLWQMAIPYVIENVEGAPLHRPTMLCGMNFRDHDLRVYRHRLFEANFGLPMMECGNFHPYPLAKMGRPVQPGEFMHVVGNFSDVKAGRAAMGIDWMTRNELREAIPPAYTEWVGRQLLAHLRVPA